MKPKWMEDNSELLLRIKEGEHAFVNFIHDRLGIIIHQHQRNDLYQMIYEACQTFDCSPQDYLQMLTQSTAHSPALDHLVAGVTVGETYFFRDKHQMQLLEYHVLPALIKDKRAKQDCSLRIWSAGCATGEEIYTIAMLLCDMLPDLNKWTLNLFGTDINTTALHNAIIGRYGEWSMRSIETKYKERYFTLSNQRYQLVNKIRDMVRFEYLNLSEDEFPSIANGTNSQDLILCRNVMIYFDSMHVSQLMKKLSECLVDEGYLLLGASDPVDIKSTSLTFHHEHGLLFSRKKLTVLPLPVPEKTVTSKWLPTKVVHKKSVLTTYPQKEVAPTLNYQDIEHLLAESKWQEVINALLLVPANTMHSAKLLVAKGTALANLGKLQEAVSAFRTSFTLDSTNKYAYLTYAFALTELNEWIEAENALKKTLFLDHQFVVGHYLLGLLYIRNKKILQGVKCLKNALAIAANHVGSDEVPGRPHLTFGRLTELLQYELELYSDTGSNHYDTNQATHSQKA